MKASNWPGTGHESKLIIKDKGSNGVVIGTLHSGHTYIISPIYQHLEYNNHCGFPVYCSLSFILFYL